jgi:protein SCO1/2
VDEQRRQARNIRLTVFALLGIIALIVGMFVRQFVAPDRLDPAWLQAHGTRLFETPRSFDEPKLIDHRGQDFSAAEFAGSWNVLFFGYTFCPDICPTTLALLRQVVADLQPASAGRAPVRVYMVSVDPARDTPELLARYVTHFSPEFTGLTGEFLDIHRFATALNTPFRKQTGGGENYAVDHGANLVLVNPRGDYAGFITPPFDKERLVQVLEALRRRDH